ncbi:MAG: riboflavin biosynthesis protein RibF [Fibrobacter sp.]|jgi:riboflavin kinase/FMN adenylyltransferase|nr:riboflavin biosynthesis protein RibF [Fibrobacter sp.]
MMGRVVSVGNFDGCHAGHQKIFERIKEIAEEKHLIPAVVSFEPHTRYVLAPSGAPQLLTTLAEKKEFVESLGLEFITLPFNPELAGMPFDSFVSTVLIPSIGTEYMVFGHDHHFGAAGRGSFDSFTEAFPKMLSEKLPAVMIGSTLVSSSVIRELLLKGDLKQSREFLGKPYRIRGTVVPGKQLGRTLGFPTANLEPETHKLIPKNGVYAGRVILSDHSVHRAVINIGCQPSVGGKSLVVEAHLLQFSGDLYGATLNIDLLEFLRPEKKFGSIEELKAGITADAAAVSGFFDPLPDA